MVGNGLKIVGLFYHCLVRQIHDAFLWVTENTPFRGLDDNASPTSH